MAITQEQLRETVARAYPNGNLAPKTIQKAFITDAAFTIDDHGYAAVVTADYTERIPARSRLCATSWATAKKW